MSKFSLFSLVFLAGVSTAVVACSSDEDAVENTGGAGGKAAAGAGGKAAGTAGKAAAGETGEGGAGGAESTLYDRLGGHDGIQAAIEAIVAEELKDDEIAAFFAPNINDATHEPQAGDIIDCFTNLLGKAAGGEEDYPFKTASGFTCRSMEESHKGLGISGGIFDRFVSIAGGVLVAADVADDDIATIAGVLNSTKEAIVEEGAGGAAGAGGSN